MSTTYDVRVRQDAYSMLLVAGRSPLSKSALEQALANALVRSMVQDESGDHIITIQLGGKSHADAFNEIFVAIQQFGYSIVAATITEWTDNLVEGAVAGCLSCGAAGSATKDPFVTLMTAIIGTVIGGIIGSFVAKKKAIYEVQRTRRGWHLVQVAPIPAQPAYA